MERRKQAQGRDSSAGYSIPDYWSGSFAPIVVSVLWSIFALAATVAWLIIRVLAVASALGPGRLTLTWAITHLTAGHDPAQIHPAKLLPQARVAKVLFNLIVE